MRKYCWSRLWLALAGVGLMCGVFSLQAGGGSIQGVAISGCVEEMKSVKPYMLAEALDANNGMVVASAPVNYDTDFFAIGPLPEGQYRLCFQFDDVSFDEPKKFSARFRSFYREEDVPLPGDSVPLVYHIRCFEEGTVINVADGVSSDVAAYLGRHCVNAEAVSAPTIQGTVEDAGGGKIEGVLVEILGACTAIVFGRTTTDASGAFSWHSGMTWSADMDYTYKVRLSDPAGNYQTTYYGASGDDFSAGTSVDGSSPIMATMLPVQPDIDVAPQVANFGNVQLPGSATTVVTIQNVGGGDLSVSSVTLVAGSSPSITIKSAPALPLTLAVNASCEVALEFRPTTLGTATATLAVGSDDPDEGTVQVALSGLGVASESPPAEQVATTLEFIEDSAADGTLQGTGPAGAADAHLQALLNQIKAASDLAAAGKLTQACQQLANAMQRTDGEPQPPDFVTGPAAAELRLLIELTRVAIGCN